MKVNDATFTTQATCESALLVPSLNYGQGLSISNTDSKFLAIANPNANPALLLSNAAQNIYNQLTINNLSINDGTTTTVNLNGSDKSLKLDDGTNHSQLTTTDLLFNGVGLKSQVDTNTQDIEGLTADVSNIKAEVIIPVMQFVTPAVYADSSKVPSTNSTWQQNYNAFGWYYKNTISGKQNYYFPPPSLNLTVGDLKGVYYQIFNACVTAGDLPYIIIRTVPTGSGDYRPWYHSSYTIVPDANSSPNEFCFMFGNLQNLNYRPHSVNCKNQFNLVASSYQPIKGDYQNDQKILSISIDTNSASTLNNCEFSLIKLGLITSYTSEYAFL
jgi:hypothetical protein